MTPAQIIAKDWLLKLTEKIHGPMNTWPASIMAQYHYELGLLMDFMTDCWPDVAVEDKP